MKSIEAVIAEFTTRYTQREYTAAYEYLTAQQPEHPHYQAPLLAWRAAMAARCGNTDLGLDLLDEIIQAGGWVHEGALAQDPDYASLQGERLQQIISACAQRRTQAKEKMRPERTVLEPVGFNGPRPLLMALHGNLGNMAAFASHWQKAAELGYRVAVLQSTQMSWVSGHYDWDNHATALPQVKAHYEQLCEQYEIEPDKTIVAGFSSGGGVSAHTAVAGALPVLGFIAMEYFRTDWDKPETWKEWFEKPAACKLGVLQFGKLSEGMDEGARLFGELLEQHGIEQRVFHTDNTVHRMVENFPQLLEEMLRCF